MAPLRILNRASLQTDKGINYSRQRLHELIAQGLFPAPDGRATDNPKSPPWWFETTIDRHLKARAKAHARDRVGRRGRR